ncbi:hypothetical protein [Variovorax sp. PAMC26660]|uniref:hypothetical protein n=1 Tax=Variovorax sp. PAMC26660 TaxID=2762322 RepID=UPI00164EC6A9|nr:hypothetical protein [Variovorax sp. PAMC26660]QNK68451.1 hypothetical protein H7F35_01500 [Variovorax sp. PAMC26660]
MATTIKALTPEILRASAQEAARQHVPFEEACHYEKGSPLWRAFQAAYVEATATELEAA